MANYALLPNMLDDVVEGSRRSSRRSVRAVVAKPNTCGFRVSTLTRPLKLFRDFDLFQGVERPRSVVHEQAELQGVAVVRVQRVSMRELVPCN